MDTEEIKYFTVSQYNQAIKNFLDSKVECQVVHIKGEVSNYKGHTRGHLYFTLKDEESRINAVMFKTSASKLDFVPKDGDEVLVTGRISVYVPTGGYQVYVEEMHLSGNGDLLKRLEELKQKLAKEGLFNQEHKKPIPKYPSKIGIVTAPTGAAIRDILSTIKRRYPICNTILFPALVQGELAKDDVVRQIKRANEFDDIDVLIVGRGGGSIEDLWAFNEECVARAIYESRIPIISAVGHEIDFTIADFVADMRAPTPTGAAEMAVPNMVDLVNYIRQLEIRLNKNIFNLIDLSKKQLTNFKNSYVLTNPLSYSEIREQKLDMIINKLNSYITHKMDISVSRYQNVISNHIILNPSELFIKNKNSLELVINKLELLNPLSVLSKGYSLSTVNGKVIKSVKDVKVNDEVNIRLLDGEINTVVKGEKENGR